MKRSWRTWLPLLLSLLVVLLVVQASAQCPAWGYRGTADGPAEWGSLCSEYAKCSTGLLQAPVDIESSVVSLDYNMGPLTFDIVDPYSDEGLNVPDTLAFWSPHSLTMEWAPGCTVTGGPLEDNVYYLSTLSFHSPAEFTFQGYRPDLALYLYHHTGAKSQVAIIVISFNTSQTATQGFLGSLIPYLPSANNSISMVPLSLNLGGLVAAAFTKGYYTLPGSLTTPPCTEDVTYAIARHILPASPSEIQIFSNMLHNNTRPVQELYGRRIKAFFPFTAVESKLSKDLGWVFVGMVVAGIVAFTIGSSLFGKAKAKRPPAHPKELVLKSGN